MGCHRSGTNLLYDVLLSAGGFAVYRGYLPIYKMISRFGPIDKPKNRERLMETWLRSKGFRRSNLDAGELTRKVLRECRSGGDFIRITMEGVAHQQNAARWAVYDPDNVLFVRQVKQDIPEALFIHIIRDGRDIALSLKKMGGFKPLPWDQGGRALQATALYWEWMVQKGKKYGAQIPSDYIEVHYEELVTEPRAALARLSQFLDQELDYDRVQAAGLGRVSSPNSSFSEERSEARSNPVNRWKQRLSDDEVAALEALVGECLVEAGYPLTVTEDERQPGIREMIMRLAYFNYFDTKLWMRINTPLGRFADLPTLELADRAPQEDPTP